MPGRMGGSLSSLECLEPPHACEQQANPFEHLSCVRNDISMSRNWKTVVSGVSVLVLIYWHATRQTATNDNAKKNGAMDDSSSVAVFCFCRSVSCLSKRAMKPSQLHERCSDVSIANSSSRSRHSVLRTKPRIAFLEISVIASAQAECQQQTYRNAKT